MKRILDGVTYNTETSTLLAKSEYDGNPGEGVEMLYQTRGGAFFVYCEEIRQVWVERSSKTVEKVTSTVEPKSSDQAQQWLMEGDREIFSNPFEDPPEASAADDRGASTLYIRVPASLKARVEKAAETEGLSANSWLMRCAERCLGQVPIPTTGSKSIL